MSKVNKINFDYSTGTHSTAWLAILSLELIFDVLKMIGVGEVGEGVVISGLWILKCLPQGFN